MVDKHTNLMDTYTAMHVSVRGAQKWRIACVSLVWCITYMA
jgi:hypothetical protein